MVYFYIMNFIRVTKVTMKSRVAYAENFIVMLMIFAGFPEAVYSNIITFYETLSFNLKIKKVHWPFVLEKSMCIY